MKSKILTLFLLCACALCAGAQQSKLTLSRCEEAALSNSPEIKRAQSLAQSARQTYLSALWPLRPSLNLTGTGGWVSEVPSFTMGGQKLEFGDKWSYTAGPSLEYILFDKGARSLSAAALLAAADSKENELAFAKKTVLSEVRLAYFAVQRDLDRIFFLTKQLEVSAKQHSDVLNSYKAGAKAELDVTMAHKQVLKAQADISAARASLGASLRNLFQLTGDNFGVNPSYPSDARAQTPPSLPAPSALIEADAPENTLAVMQQYETYVFDEQSPRLISLDKISDYYLKTSQSYSSSLWPKISLGAGAYFEYPNGPVREHIFLGQTYVGLKMPLFESGKSKKKAAAQKFEAQAALHQKKQAKDELENIFYTNKDRALSLRTDVALARSLVADSEKASVLTYRSYTAGTVTFLEVDNANLTLLKNRISLAEITIERLSRLAVMGGLGRQEGL